MELWTKLVERYHVPESLPEKVTERIRLRVGVFMTAWLKSKHDDFSEDLRAKINQFASSVCIYYAFLIYSYTRVARWLSYG